MIKMRSLSSKENANIPYGIGSHGECARSPTKKITWLIALRSLSVMLN
jgi:hypothetical protein